MLYHSLSPYEVSEDIVGYERDLHTILAKALYNYIPDRMEIECWRPDVSIKKKLIFNKDGITYRIFPSIRIGGKDFSPSMWLGLKRLAKKERFIVHLHGLFNPTTYAIPMLVKDMPIIAQAHGRHIFKPSFKDMIRKRIFFNIDRLIVPTEENKNFLKELYGIDKIDVIPGKPIDFDVFKSVDKMFSRNQLSLAQDKRYIIFVGRLDEQKGLAYLLEAFSMVRYRHKDIVLLLVWEGPLKERWVELAKHFNIQEYVKFVGYVDNERLPFYYNASDMLVLASLSEGLPSVLIEAMACGLPVIGTSIEGIRQIMENFNGGLMVPPQDSTALADAIDRVLGDAEKFAPKDRLRAREYYHAPYVVKRIFNIYKKLWQEIR